MSWFLAVLRRIGAFTLLTFWLAWLGAASLAWQAAGTDRLLDREQLLATTTLALAIGWLVARRQWEGASLACVVAAWVALIVVRAGGLEARLAAATIEFLRFGIARLGGDLAADAVPLLEALAALATGFGTVAGRTADWLLTRVSHQTAVDPVALNLAWNAGASLTAMWTAWQVRRRAQPAHALLPATLAVVAIGYLQGTYPTMLPAALLALLGLHASLTYARQEARWREQGVDYSEDVRLDIGVSAGTLVALLVLAAALAPSVRWQEVVQRAESFARSLVAVRAAPTTGASSAANQPRPPPPAGTESPFEPLRVTGLPRRHLIGTGPELSHRIVFTARVSTDDSQSLSSPYWRALTYDRYIGSGWATSSVEATAYRAGESLQEDGGAGTVRVRQHVERASGQSELVYVAGFVQSASEPYIIGRRSAEDIFGALIAARAYDAESFVPVPAEPALSSVAEIPAWIGDRYLALPDDLPPRVQALARSLTAAEPSAYARAQAIERYVRAFTYTLDLPPPPAGRDIADYYLFELQRGYCDYSATAFVVLARAAGLPARLVIGYAPGERDPASGLITVTAAQAHSWGEVYLGAAGWVEFEPTGGYPPLERVRSARQIPNRPAGGALLTIPPVDASTVLWWAAAALLLGAASAALVVGMPIAAEEFQLRRADSNRLSALLFNRLRRASVTLGVPLLESDTPLEFADKIDAALQQLVPERDAGAALRLVAERYQQARYSRLGVNQADMLAAVAAERLARAEIFRARWRRWKRRAHAFLRAHPAAMD